MVFLQCVQNVVRFSLRRRCCCYFLVFFLLFVLVKHIFRIVFNVLAPLGVRVALYLSFSSILLSDVSKEIEIYLSFFFRLCGEYFGVDLNIYISISHGFEEFVVAQKSFFIDRTFFPHIWDHNIHYFLDTFT